MRPIYNLRLAGLVCISLLCIWRQEAHANLDIAFVLDTTGSMSKELREVKEKVGVIADSLKKTRPNQTVRIGVVAYRDVTDEYVTKFSPLSSDAEVAFGFLSKLRAKGGGDRPEHVLAGLESAIVDLDWDKNSKTQKQIFLIGDAAAQVSYAKQKSLEEIGQLARENHVIINSIGCRSLSPRGIHQFRTIAYSTEGRYQHIGGIRNDAASLTSSVLTILSEATNEAPDSATIVDAILTDKEIVSSNEPFFVALFKADSVQGKYCKIWLQTPEGWDLNGEPVLRYKNDNIYVVTQLKSGVSHRYGLTLKECLENEKTINVQIEDTI
ncbi:MAG: vWA domain-containing protein [Myxococcota bacterium]|nr:vWA domain-containing protein [Myxococcota bacterium]